MIYGSVCSGIEAATVAWHPLGWTPAWFCEFDKWPSAALAHHYPNVPNLHDMTKIEERKEYHEQSIDLLVGGTPCQSFSVAGLRKGLDDERGNLALKFCRILDDKKPRWFVWENVPGVLSSNEGRDFAAILSGFRECGYGFAYRILDAQYFGVPQRRRRVFVVGYSGDWRPPAAVLFERESLRGDTPPRREAGQEITPTIRSGPPNGGPGHGQRSGDSRDELIVPVAMTVTPSHDPAVTLTARDYKGPLQEADLSTVIAFNSREECVSSEKHFGSLGASSPQAQAIAYGIPGNWIGRKPENGGNATTPMIETSPNLTSTDRHAVAYGVGERNDVAHCLRSGASKADKHESTTYIKQSSAVRRLTPVECERLQGFPDNYTRISSKTADGPRYKALGNSMAVPVMRWLGERINSVEKVLADIE